jgi:hypothetical protein
MTKLGQRFLLPQILLTVLAVWMKQIDLRRFCAVISAVIFLANFTPNSASARLELGHRAKGFDAEKHETRVLNDGKEFRNEEKAPVRAGPVRNP